MVHEVSYSVMHFALITKLEVDLSMCTAVFWKDKSKPVKYVNRDVVIDLDVCVSEAGDRQLCTVGCLQNRAPMELLLPLHWGAKHCLYLHIQYKSCIYLNFLHEIFK